jgi:hypothetical protein
MKFLEALRFYIIVDVAENIIGAFTDENFDHFDVADLHGDFDGRDLSTSSRSARVSVS